jgi:hypothetical protein
VTPAELAVNRLRMSCYIDQKHLSEHTLSFRVSSGVG